MKNTLKPGVLGVVVLLAAGCAGTPTTGEKMLSRSEAAQDIGKQWNQGNELVLKGEKLQAKGERQVEDGKDNIKDGQSMVKKGQRLMEKSEARYRKNFPGETL
ncbi:hypothetical protein GCM10022421_19530 [Oceanisphaera sediminis]|uniref:Lipoprotein n=1 Tax=Oceanisphaera sediminis TaxID=981381 RepID=A0ABP7E180_9GAMM